MPERIYDLELSALEQRLEQLRDCPKRLFCQGYFPVADELASVRGIIGVIGTRKPSDVGRRIAYQLGFDIASKGGIVVSGGALGVDAEAHQGCIDGGGATWVILPSTVEHPLPRSNKRLFANVVSSGGALLSEFEEPPKGKYAFCTRNRIIAALCDVLVVVEAFQKSGTFHTVRVAQQLRRPIFTVPWRWADPGSSVFHQLLSSGATALGNTAELFGNIPEPAGQKGQRDFSELSTPLQRDIARFLLEKDHASIEDLIWNLNGHARSDIVSSVMKLELNSLVEQDAFGVLRLSRVFSSLKR